MNTVNTCPNENVSVEMAQTHFWYLAFSQRWVNISSCVCNCKKTCLVITYIHGQVNKISEKKLKY